MKLPATTKRVARHTAPEINRRIMADIEHRLWYYLDHRADIDVQLQELDEEWDIERALEANASSLALAGLLLGFVASRKFLLLPAVVAGFLLQHSLQGWCPPVPLLRRFGFRTQSEIELERYALKALRGDFAHYGEAVPAAERDADLPARLLHAVQQ